MRLKRIVIVALLGAVLIGASAASAAENKADWTTTLNVNLALLDKLGGEGFKILAVHRA